MEIMNNDFAWMKQEQTSYELIALISAWLSSLDSAGMVGACNVQTI